MIDQNLTNKEFGTELCENITISWEIIDRKMTNVVVFRYVKIFGIILIE